MNIVTPTENIYVPGQAPVKEPHFERFGGNLPFGRIKQDNSYDEDDKNFQYNNIYNNYPTPTNYHGNVIPYEKKDPMIWDPPSPKGFYKPKAIPKPRVNPKIKKPAKGVSQP